MRCQQIAVHSFLAFALVGAHGQGNASGDDVRISQQQCQIIRMVLSARERQRSKGDVPGNDDFTAAGQACDRLDSAVSSSDPGKIQSAAADLRPILARLGRPPASAQEQFAAIETKDAGLTGADLFYQLPDLAKRAFKAGEFDKAGHYSNELLEMAPQYPKDWNYGNAVFYGNLVLGRIAVSRGNLPQAGQYLLAAGASSGSPQLNSFGPNMSLAKELLEKGQSAVVVQYFALCKKFWKMDYGKLDQWTAAARAGKVPDFGANLNY